MLLQEIVKLVERSMNLPREAFTLFRLHYLDDTQRRSLNLSSPFAVGVTLNDRQPISRVGDGYGPAAQMQSEILIDVLSMQDDPLTLVRHVETLQKAMYDFSVTTPAKLGDHLVTGMLEQSTVYRYNSSDRPVCELSYVIVTPLRYDTN